VYYDIDYIDVRAAWVLEAITFNDFGFRNVTLTERALIDAARDGRRDVLLEEALPQLRQLNEQARREGAEVAKRWWRVSETNWSRYSGLLDALQSDDSDRVFWAVHFLRFGESPCPGLDASSYRRDIFPIIRRLAAQTTDDSLRDQLRLLLEDENWPR
jgi:hypothetical protein